MMHLKYHAFLVLEDGTTKDTRRTTKRRIASVVRGISWVKGYIQVRYYRDDLFVGDNVGVCDTPDEMIKTLDTFTEPEMMEYLS